jgi:hypothetical protein
MGAVRPWHLGVCALCVIAVVAVVFIIVGMIRRR